MPGWTRASTMPEPAREQAERSVLRELLAFAGRTPLSAAGAIVGLLVIAMALGAPWIAPHDPLKTNFRRMNHAPDAQSLFGTDQVGRDTLSRVIHGARTSLFVAISAGASTWPASASWRSCRRSRISSWPWPFPWPSGRDCRP